MLYQVLNDMSGIDRLLAKHCVQTAVYWANPVKDGYGSHTFDAPIEIDVRWEDKTQVMTVGGPSEEKHITRTIVFTKQRTYENEILWLGGLDDLTTEEKADPKSVEGAYIIKRPENTPALGSTTSFLYKAFLTPWLS